MRLLLMLLYLLLPSLLSGAVFTYTPSSMGFSFSDHGLSFSSLSSALRIKEGVLTAGGLSEEALQKLFSPYEGNAALSGVVISDEKAGFFVLSSPSFGGGLWHSWKYGGLSFGYVSASAVSDTLFLHASERGGYESVHMRGDVSVKGVGLFVKGSFSAETGFDFVYGGTVSFRGVHLGYAEGTLLSLVEEDGIRRRVEAGISGGGVSYKASLSWGSDAITAGTFRRHTGKEELSVRIGRVTLGARRSGTFSSDGRTSAASVYVIRLFGLTFGFDEELEPVFGYEDDALYIRFEDGVIRVRCSFRTGRLRISLGFSSEGSVSSSLRLEV